MANLGDVLPFQGERGLTGDNGETGDTGSRAATTSAGLIGVWAGTLATIPSGWVLCNGSNGTPDLRDQFIKGAPDSTDPGGTGGNATHGHDSHAARSHSGTSVSDHASLTHSGFSITDHQYNRYYAGGANISHWTHSVTQASAHAAVSHTVSAQPSDHALQSHVSTDNLPVYYAVAFIMYVGV